MKKLHIPELLAPVGSYEALYAAIHGGADSIYFGAGTLNMRARSIAGLSLKDIYKVSSICHQSKIKCYFTLNSIIYDGDMKQMKKTILTCKKAEIDGIIVSDAAAMIAAREANIPVHISTQMNLSNFEAVRFFSAFADVMVLARELSLIQITAICNKIRKENLFGPSGKQVRIEVFIHGALCMAISGKCYLSEHLHNASANRGACYQVCRRPFLVTDDRGEELLLDNPYILSPKDLCTIDFLDKIIASGVSVLKIEGRGRQADYVKTVVSSYRKAIDAIRFGVFHENLKAKLQVELSKVYNRGFYSGYYLGKEISDWNTNAGGSKATELKTYVGKVIRYFKKISVAEIQLESGFLNENDKFILTGPTTGIVEGKIQNMIIDEVSVKCIKAPGRFTIHTDQLVRPGDKVFRIDLRQKLS